MLPFKLLKTIGQRASLTTILLMVCSSLLNAQNFIGLQHSNLSGIHQARFNPANIADSRHRLYVNGYTMGFGFNNDYLQLDLPFSVFGLVNKSLVDDKYKTGNKINFDDSWITENLNGKAKNLNVYSEVRTPGMMLKLSKKVSVGFQIRNMVSIQANDVSESLARLARYGVDSTLNNTIYSGPNTYKVGENFEDNKFSININTWGEIAGTIAALVVDEETLKVKVGFTPKYLMGYMSGYFRNEGVQFKIMGTDSVVFQQTDISFGYTNLIDFNSFNPRNPLSFLNNKIENKIKGGGFGYDFGVTFEFNPKIAKAVTSHKNKYLFRGGISLLDGGKVSYGTSMKNVFISGSNVNKTFIFGDEFKDAFAKSKVDGIIYTDSVIRTIFDVTTTDATVSSKMPTTLNFQFDYNVLKFFYVGANWSQDLRSKLVTGIRRPSYIVVIPRFESKLFEVSIPIGMMNDYKTGRIGAFVRVGPVFIGTDNLVGQIRSSKYYGSDLYFGISSSIPSKKKG